MNKYLGVVFGVLLGAAPADTVAGALPSAFFYPEAAQDHKLRLAVRQSGTDLPLSSSRPTRGVLSIDGQVTGFDWDGNLLVSHRLGPWHYVLEPLDRDQSLLLWDTKNKRLTSLGKAWPSRGVFLQYESARLAVLDIDPKSFKLRTLWSVESKARVEILSDYHKGVRLLVEHSGQTFLVTLEPNHLAQEARVELGDFSSISYDGIRGDRILVARLRPKATTPGSLADVGIFDVLTGKIRVLPQKAEIGMVTCQNSVPTALSVEWITKENAQATAPDTFALAPFHGVQFGSFCTSVSNFVEEDSETMFTVGHHK